MGPNSKDKLADALLALVDELRMQRGTLLHVARKVGVHEDDLTELKMRVYNLEPLGSHSGNAE